MSAPKEIFVGKRNVSSSLAFITEFWEWTMQQIEEETNNGAATDNRTRSGAFAARL